MYVYSVVARTKWSCPPKQATARYGSLMKYARSTIAPSLSLACSLHKIERSPVWRSSFSLRRYIYSLPLFPPAFIYICMYDVLFATMSACRTTRARISRDSRAPLTGLSDRHASTTLSGSWSWPSGACARFCESKASGRVYHLTEKCGNLSAARRL